MYTVSKGVVFLVDPQGQYLGPDLLALSDFCWPLANRPVLVMVPTLFEIQNSRTFQGPFKDFSIFVKDLFVHFKKVTKISLG